jgi:serine/threonine-protein kinase
VSVPDVGGQRQLQAERTIRVAGFTPEVVEDSDTTEPKGTVVRQIPGAGNEADKGSTVTIFVSTFEEPTETPTVPPTPPPTETPTLPVPTTPAPSPTGRRAP